MNVKAGLPCAHVAVGIALEISGGDEAVDAVRSDEALKELGKVGGADHALIGAPITSVELSVSIAAAERDGVLAALPDGVRGRHETILEDARVSGLRGRAFTDAKSEVGHGLSDAVR